jgi:hypothetical protein
MSALRGGGAAFGAAGGGGAKVVAAVEAEVVFLAVGTAAAGGVPQPQGGEDGQEGGEHPVGDDEVVNDLQDGGTDGGGAGIDFVAGECEAEEMDAGEGTGVVLDSLGADGGDGGGEMGEGGGAGGLADVGAMPPFEGEVAGGRVEVTSPAGGAGDDGLFVAPEVGAPVAARGEGDEGEEKEEGEGGEDVEEVTAHGFSDWVRGIVPWGDEEMRKSGNEELRK